MSRAWRRGLAALAGLIIVVLVAGQLLIPTIANDIVKSSLSQYASGVKISLSATPAFKLLFGKADDVQVQMAVLHARGKANVTQLLQRTEQTGDADVSIGKLYTPQGVLFENVTMHKRSAKLSAGATITAAQVAAALPVGITLDVNPHVNGPAPVAISAHLTILGQTLSATGVVEAMNGGVYVVPDNSLIPAIKLFEDPRISIDTLTLNVDNGAYAFSASGHLTS